MTESTDDCGGLVCPRCMGDRTVDCYCGGDLCVCENYGERDCPVCYGEGEVSEAREAMYLEHQRQAHEAMRRAWAESEATGNPSAPTLGTEPSSGGVNQA